MEIQSNTQFGNRYVVSKEYGDSISIARNYRVEGIFQRDKSRRYYIEIRNQHRFEGIAVSEEDMLELFAAFLAVQETYEKEE